MAGRPGLRACTALPSILGPSGQTAPTLGKVGLLYADRAGTQFVLDMPGIEKPPGASMVTCRVPMWVTCLNEYLSSEH